MEQVEWLLYPFIPPWKSDHYTGDQEKARQRWYFRLLCKTDQREPILLLLIQRKQRKTSDEVDSENEDLDAEDNIGTVFYVTCKCNLSDSKSDGRISQTQITCCRYQIVPKVAGD